MTEREITPTPQLDPEQTAAIQELTIRATKSFGSDALFAYPKGDIPPVLTLHEAIAICGEHIADVPVDMVLGMLKSWRVVAPGEHSSPEDKKLFNESLRRGQESLARHALKQEG